MKQFGGKITQENIKRYEESDHWKNGKFANLEKTLMNISFKHIPNLLYKQFIENKGRKPNQGIPIKPFQKEAFLSPSENIKFIWYGHSVVLMNINQQIILFDPMFGSNAAPISHFP